MQNAAHPFFVPVKYDEIMRRLFSLPVFLQPPQQATGRLIGRKMIVASAAAALGAESIQISHAGYRRTRRRITSGFFFWASKTLFFLTRQKENGVWVRTSSLYCKSFLLPLKKRCGASASRGRGKTSRPAFFCQRQKKAFLGLRKKRRLEAPPEVPTNLSGAQTLNCLCVMRRCR